MCRKARLVVSVLVATLQETRAPIHALPAQAAAHKHRQAKQLAIPAPQATTTVNEGRRPVRNAIPEHFRLKRARQFVMPALWAEPSLRQARTLVTIARKGRTRARTAPYCALNVFQERSLATRPPSAACFAPWARSRARPGRAFAVRACSKGSFALAEGSSSCTACAAGKFNTISEATSCTECSAGEGHLPAASASTLYICILKFLLSLSRSLPFSLFPFYSFSIDFLFAYLFSSLFFSLCFSLSLSLPLALYRSFNNPFGLLFLLYGAR